MSLNPAPEERPAVPPGLYGNITEKELDRDIRNLQLPEADSLFATEEELRAMYPPGDFERLQEELDNP
ncbi:hypothetical protein [Hymenobacter sp. HDW8]|uniref:hypothetical protein n=1 Tax=Hymenobacter sp. HDW8 TaxID=2714932 RepID=UPI00140E1C6F|nr:hypothetical protein [Hymenobacter sp. HDW8]QIL78446.1 hypothetical protein G7064_21740 [Hymenobacter sp. HDW8]